MENTNQRPLVIELHETKEELMSTINSIIKKHQLPYYLCESMFFEIYTQIKDASRFELQNAKNQLEADNTIQTKE